MTVPLPATRWRKASQSGYESACVEVGNTLTALRDSKNPGPVLPANVPVLLAGVKDGRIG
jgi:Domain of unknown function (DUF397)